MVTLSSTKGFGPGPHPQPPPHARLNKTARVDEGSILGTTTRHYQLYVPRQLATTTTTTTTTKRPLILHFHGQGVVQPLHSPRHQGVSDPNTPRYDQLADENGFIMAYPLGMGDGNCGVGWNVLGQNASLKPTCSSEAWSTPDGCGCTCCYESCMKLGKCKKDNEPGYCGWSTCHDDVAFIKVLLATVISEYSVDTAAIFVTGASNGGMFVNYLLSQMPSATFRGAVVVYGDPLKGELSVPAGLGGTALMSLHGRWDTVIPVSGGLSGQGWYYTPEADTLNAWAAVHHCDRQRTAPPPIARAGVAAAAATCSEASFPFNLDGVQCTGLVASPAATSEEECAAACCERMKSAGQGCNVWQYGWSSCWIGNIDGGAEDSNCMTADENWLGASTIPVPRAPPPPPVNPPKGMVAYPSPFSPGDGVALECSAYTGCKGGDVVQCLYDGAHGGWIENGCDLVIWFMLNRTLL